MFKQLLLKLFLYVFQKALEAEETPYYITDPDLNVDLEKHKEDDAGFDVPVRAIIVPETKDEIRNRKIPYLRKTLWDLKSEPSPEARQHLGDDCCVNTPDGWVYILKPGKSIYLGTGVCLRALRFVVWKVVARSSTVRSATRGCVLEVISSDVVGDPKYFGETSAELYNHGPADLHLKRGMQLLQIERKLRDLSRMRKAESHDELDCGCAGTECRHRRFGTNGHTDRTP